VRQAGASHFGGATDRRCFYQAKEDAAELMAQKVELEKEKKAIIELAGEKEVALKQKIGTIGNIVHDSVPIHNNEV
jgi:seryl-tRNA synthetase